MALVSPVCVFVHFKPRPALALGARNAGVKRPLDVSPFYSSGGEAVHYLVAEYAVYKDGGYDSYHYCREHLRIVRVIRPYKL